jgi:GAF domain-containing protein
MLADDGGESLVGKMGIGELEEVKARAAWRADTAEGLNDFERYLRRLEKGEIELTTVGKQARGLRLPIHGSGVFSEVVQSGKLQHVPVEQPDRIPARFAKLFRVRTPMVVAPLVDKGQVIGVLAVDNKFTQAPVGDDLCNALMAFASTAAVAIENKRLFDQTRGGAEKLLSFYQMSRELISLQEPGEILEKIVEQTVTAARASWVSILLIDRSGRAFNPIQSGRQFSMDPRDIVPIRKKGISMRVMSTGQTFPIENVAKMGDRVNLELMERSVKAAICLPLSLPGKRIGVMWIHYDEPHRFPNSEIAALQLYVNQAAIAYDSARRIETLEDMRVISTALAEVDDMKSMLQRIVRGAQQVLKADETVLWLYDAKTDHFIPESSAYAGKYPAVWSEFQKKVPQKRGTAFRIMDRSWMCAEEIHKGDQNRDVGPTMRQFLTEIGGRGFQGVALKVGREKLGVLYAIYAKPRRFDEEERETALTFANHAALALKKAKLFDQVQRAQEAAEVVTRVTLLEDPKNTLLSIAREIRAALDCGAVILFRYGEETGELIPPMAVTGLHPRGETMAHTLPLAMVEYDGPYVVPDVTQDENFKDSPFVQAQGIKSCVVIPLRAAGRKVGVMFINYRTPRRFTADELTNMELFANQAAVAIRNIQLFEESATKLGQQEALATLSRELLLAKSLQETLDRAVEFAAKVLDTEFSDIVLPDREGRLVFSAGVGWEQEMVGNLILERGERSQTGYTIRKRAPVAVYNYSEVTEFKVPEVVSEHAIQSGLSVPMFREEKIVGAMLVHTMRSRRFTEGDETLLSLIANQTAIALEGVRQYEASQRKSVYLEALYNVSKAITAQVGLEQRQILEQIVQPAMKVIVGIQGPKHVLSTIQFYDEESDKLALVSVSPPERFTEIEKRLGEQGTLQALLRKGEKIGVSGRTVLTRKPRLLRDVRSDPDYIGCPPETRSELAVPLIDRDLDKVIGVLNVESDQVFAFDGEDEEALKALAELTVVALQNARQAKELNEAMEAQRALAWMGIGNANLLHEVRGYLGMFRNELYLLRNNLDREGQVNEPLLISHLETMNDEAEQLSARLKVLSRDEGEGKANSLIRVNENLILNRKRQLKGRQLEDVPLSIQCGLAHDTSVRANAYWLNRAIDILLRNAVEATEGQSNREIVLGSRRSGDQAEVYVEDNGQGVPADLVPKLFRMRVNHSGSPGLGVGLLMAKAIIQTYGGLIRYAPRVPEGTSMIISLPLEDGRHEESNPTR